MNIEDVYDIIHRISEGFEGNALQCLDRHSGNVVIAIQEQIYSGQDSEGETLTPTYDDDPFFDEEGPWKGRAKEYKAWKRSITPPKASTLLGLPARPVEVPNLFINGKFFSEINADMAGDELVVDPGMGDGPAIVSKYGGYGHDILGMGDAAKVYFNGQFMLPALEKFFTDCGYRQ